MGAPDVPVNAVDSINKTPLDYAMANDQKEVAVALMFGMAVIDTPQGFTAFFELTTCFNTSEASEKLELYFIGTEKRIRAETLSILLGECNHDMI